MTPPRAVAAYSRVSTLLQATDGMSLEAQERAIREYCARQDWPAPIMYVDAGRSAYKEAVKARPKFAQLLRDVAEGAIDAVVIWHLNRWARRVTVTHNTINHLKAAGVPLISISQHLDYASPAGKLTLTMLAGIAEFESDEKSEGAIRTHADLRSQGKWSGGTSPFGSMVGDDGRLTLHSEKSKSLARLLELVAATNGYRAADALNAEGYPAPGTYRNGPMHPARLWTAQSVYAIMAKASWLLDQPEPWPGRYLAAATRPPAPPVARRRAIRPLTGLLRCGTCGAAAGYTTDTRPDRGVVTLRCPHQGYCTYYGKAAGHEAAILAAVSRLVPPSVHAAPSVDARAYREITEERQIAYIGLRDKHLKVHEYEEEMARLAAREVALVARGVGARDLGRVADVLPHLGTLTDVELNEIYRLLIERIELTGKHSRRIIWRSDVAATFGGVQ